MDESTDLIIFSSFIATSVVSTIAIHLNDRRKKKEWEFWEKVRREQAQREQIEEWRTAVQEIQNWKNSGYTTPWRDELRTYSFPFFEIHFKEQVENTVHLRRVGFTITLSIKPCSDGWSISPPDEWLQKAWLRSGYLLHDVAQYAVVPNSVDMDGRNVPDTTPLVWVLNQKVMDKMYTLLEAKRETPDLLREVCSPEILHEIDDLYRKAIKSDEPSDEPWRWKDEPGGMFSGIVAMFSRMYPHSRDHRIFLKREGNQYTKMSPQFLFLWGHDPFSSGTNGATRLEHWNYGATPCEPPPIKSSWYSWSKESGEWVWLLAVGRV